ncbi:MAG TPA: phosphate signaling complex protein PhoU [Bacteroidia bacterium]|jgi:phosphate transport system protein|nr:phosphate signaling complex protein PhoU [Bacteroidia bacterium]
MEHLKSELDSLRSELTEMYALVHNQLEKAQDVFLENKTSLIKEITSTEKLVNAKELQIDSRCETILALFTPVAVDLRFVLSALKINTNLERIADIADGISRMVVHSKVSFDKNLLVKIQAKEAFSQALVMITCLEEAFQKEDTLLARDIFSKDKVIDQIMNNATGIAEEYSKDSPENLLQAIPLLSIMKMLERTGDHLKNIAEEIIFYAEAKVLKHAEKKSDI